MLPLQAGVLLFLLLLVKPKTEIPEIPNVSFRFVLDLFLERLRRLPEVLAPDLAQVILDYRIPASAPSVLQRLNRDLPPSTPVNVRRGPAPAPPPRAPGFEVQHAAAAAGAADALLDLLDPQPFVAPIVDLSLTARVQLQISRIPGIDEYAESVPLVVAGTAKVELQFEMAFCGLVEIRRRLEFAGHSLALDEDSGSTRGPWTITLLGFKKQSHILRRFDRLCLFSLKMRFGAVNQPCTCFLSGDPHWLSEIKSVICSVVPVILPKSLESVRELIEADRSMFPIAVRKDPKSGSSSSFSPMSDSDCDVISLDFLTFLVRITRFNCANEACSKSSRGGLVFRRGKFHQLELVHLCRCGTTTLYLQKRLDKECQRVRRAAAFASICSFPKLDQLDRWCHLMALPSLGKLRVTENRLSVGKLCSNPIRELGQQHMRKQMQFHAEAAKRLSTDHAKIDTFLNGLLVLKRGPNAEDAATSTQLIDDLVAAKSVSFENGLLVPCLPMTETLRRAVFGSAFSVNVEEIESSVSALAGDGQYTRNTRAFGAGHAPHCVVSIISCVTGAVVVQVVVARAELAAANRKAEDEAKAALPDASAKEKKQFMSEKCAFWYKFLGQEIGTSYVLGEGAALEIALKILRIELGEDAVKEGIAYDDLTSCAATLAKVFPDTPKIGDPWHSTKGFRKRVEELESDVRFKGEFVGLPAFLMPTLRQMFKSKTKSVIEKAAWARGWRLLNGKVLQQDAQIVSWLS